MRVAMIGTGYVGLVSGACFADFGHEVTCVDKDAGQDRALERGEMPIYEPGLDELVAANARPGGSPSPAICRRGAAADAVFIAVGTPSRRGDGHADLLRLCRGREIAAALDGFTVVVTKSTVPVGTGDEVERIIRERGPTPSSPWCPTRSSCAKARRSRTSSARPGGRRPRGRARARGDGRSSIARSISTRRRSCSPTGAPRS